MAIQFVPSDIDLMAFLKDKLAPVKAGTPVFEVIQGHMANHRIPIDVENNFKELEWALGEMIKEGYVMIKLKREEKDNYLTYTIVRTGRPLT